jgi:hypothetical protein
MLKRLVASAILIMAAGHAMAADMPVKAVKAAPAIWYNDILAANNQISLDITYTKMDYVENYPCVIPNIGLANDCAPGIFDQEHGWLPGLTVTGSWMGDLAGIHNLYVWGAGSWSKGNVNYSAGNGQTLVNGAEIWNADFRFGKGFDISKTVMLTPYIGVGGNWWSRNITGPGGYHEDYSHGYAGGGLLLQFVPVSRMVVSVNGLVGSTFSSSMTSSLNGGFPITPQTYTLGNKVMYNAGISLDYAFTQQLHGNVGFDYQHFNYGQSPVSQIDFTLEPASRTDYYTVKAGLGYSFYAPAIVAKY